MESFKTTIRIFSLSSRWRGYVQGKRNPEAFWLPQAWKWRHDEIGLYWELPFYLLYLAVITTEENLYALR